MNALEIKYAIAAFVAMMDKWIEEVAKSFIHQSHSDQVIINFNNIFFHIYLKELNYPLSFSI